jgi:DNA-binding NtrC family response regulator
MRKILLVDDDDGFRGSLALTLRQKGFQADAARNGVEALAHLADQSYALILSDVRMQPMNGVEFLRRVKERSPHTPVLMMTAYQDASDAVEVMKLGARDYLFKPFDSNLLLSKIREVLPEPGERPVGFDDIVTCDPGMVKLLAMLDTVGESDATVILFGESGTGKEVFARAIHRRSPRSNAWFVPVNCASLPEHLLESELFGHEKGAFTGALQQHQGKFEQANGGTLLLDEIAEMPLSLQPKLLRALQEREIDRLGGKRPVKVDVRVIATTNRNLQEMMENGEFRRDLFYRLCVVPITLPPLRERRGDIALLAGHFLREFCAQNRKNIADFDPAALHWLEAQPWPGNVRQLRNVIERAVILCPTTVMDLTHLNPESWAVVEPSLEPAAEPGRLDVRVGMTAEEVEKELILRTLEQCQGNKSRAAEVLGLTPRTIRNKLKEYGLMGGGEHA